MKEVNNRALVLHPASKLVAYNEVQDSYAKLENAKCCLEPLNDENQEESKTQDKSQISTVKMK